MGRRIGEILLEHDWVESKVLERALAKQRETGKRLCSLLIAGGLLSLDEASRALGEQHGVLAVLQKHLDGRDPELAKRLPNELARSVIALPIGRMRNGDVIVCVRDPKPQLAAALSRAMSEQVVLAIAPAHALEALVAEVYPNDGPDDRPDDRPGDGPVHTLDLDPIEDLTDQIADAGDSLIGFGEMNLVELDAVGVSKDAGTEPPVVSTRPTRSSLPPATEARPTRSSLPPATEARPTRSSLPPATASRPVESALAGIAMSRTTTPTSLAATASLPRTSTPARLEAKAAIAMGSEPPSRRFVELESSTAGSLSALAQAPTPADVADEAMRFASTRWATALLLAITDGAALGHRGHGPQLSRDAVEAITIPLSAASIIKAALDDDGPVTVVPAGTGAVQERLERMLGLPRCPAAIAITVGDRRAYVLAIGDPLTDASAATSDLDRLARALGAAFARVAAS